MTRVHIGNICAIAHSTALPTYISSTQASNATSSQLTVIANSPACDIVSRRTAEQRTSTHRIEDENGGFCGLLTLVGIGGPLTPGTRMSIHVRFPICHDDVICDGAGVIPCHRVTCAVVGQEHAVFEESLSDILSIGRKRVKTRNYVFDSAYETVEFGYTEAISMGLVLPLDCPVTVKTDLVELTVLLKIEFTVSRAIVTSSDACVYDSYQRELSTIRLELPCEVVHENERSSNYFSDGNLEEDVHATSSRRMQNSWRYSSDTHGKGVDDIDIRADLNTLSIRMVGSYLNQESKIDGS